MRRGLSTAAAAEAGPGGAGRGSPERLRAAVRACVSTVKERDYEAYATISVAAPARAHAALFAVRAFNLETSGLKDTVSEAAIGSMRVQWWREALDGVFSGGPPPAMPAAEALAGVLRRHRLSRALLERVLDAREEDLYRGQPETAREVEEYAERTSGSLVALAAEALGVAGDGPGGAEAARAAALVGRAAGLVNLLRSTPHHVARRQLYVPREVAARHGLNTGALLDRRERGGDENVDNLRDATHELAVLAHERLTEARAMAPEVPRAAVPALLLTVACDRYLARLQACNFDVFHPDLAAPTSRSPLGFQARVLAASWRGRY